MHPRQAQILEAALCAFDERGVLGATLDDIRQASGASIGSIYHHFADKEGIVVALHAQVLRRYQAGFVGALLGRDARDGVRSVVDYHLRWAVAHPAEMRYLLSGPPVGDAVKEANRAFFRSVRTWWEARPELRKLDLATTHAVWLGPATEYCRHWLGGRAPRPGARRRALFSDIAWRSLCP